MGVHCAEMLLKYKLACMQVVSLPCIFIMQEIDYTLEGQNADRFRKNFGSTPWIRVPRIYWEQTSPQVLTMEYTPGIKINQVIDLDAKGVDRKLLAKRAVESYLQQLLTFGFFHAGEILLTSVGSR